MDIENAKRAIENLRRKVAQHDKDIATHSAGPVVNSLAKELEPLISICGEIGILGATIAVDRATLKFLESKLKDAMLDKLKEQWNN